MSVGPIPDITGGLTVGPSGSLTDPNLHNNYGPARLPLAHPGATCYAQDTTCCIQGCDTPTPCPCYPCPPSFISTNQRKVLLQ